MLRHLSIRGAHRNGASSGGWRRLLYAIGLAVGLALFVREVWTSGKTVETRTAIAVDPFQIALGVLFSIVMYAVQMVAWLLIMRYLGVRVGLGRTLRGYTLSFLPRYIPGSVWGYLSRSQWLAQTLGVDYSTSMLGSILEVLGFLSTALSLICMYSSGLVSCGLRSLCVLAGLGILAICCTAVPGVLGLIYTKVLKRSFSATRQRSRGPWVYWLAAVMLYLFCWAAYGGSVLLVIDALSIHRSSDVLGTVAVTALAWTLGFIAIGVPSGIGVRELALSTLLSRYIGVPSGQADLIAVVSRLAIVVSELAWLVVGLTMQAFSHREGERTGGVSGIQL